MKKIIFYSGYLLFAFSGMAQESDEQKVEQRVKQLNDAVFINKDAAALNELLAEKVSYGHSGGNVEGREEMIKNAVNSKTTYKNFAMTGFTVFFEGKNTAIVRHSLTAETFDNGKEGKLNIGILQVWVKQNKRWKLTARQSVRL